MIIENVFQVKTTECKFQLMLLLLLFTIQLNLGIHNSVQCQIVEFACVLKPLLVTIQCILFILSQMKAAFLVYSNLGQQHLVYCNLGQQHLGQNNLGQ